MSIYIAQTTWDQGSRSDNWVQIILFSVGQIRTSITKAVSPQRDSWICVCLIQNGAMPTHNHPCTYASPTRATFFTKWWMSFVRCTSLLDAHHIKCMSPLRPELIKPCTELNVPSLAPPTHIERRSEARTESFTSQSIIPVLPWKVKLQCLTKKTHTHIFQ